MYNFDKKIAASDRKKILTFCIQFEYKIHMYENEKKNLPHLYLQFLVASKKSTYIILVNNG